MLHLNAASSTVVTTQQEIFTWQWPTAKHSQTIKTSKDKKA